MAIRKGLSTLRSLLGSWAVKFAVGFVCIGIGPGAGLAAAELSIDPGSQVNVTLRTKDDPNDANNVLFELDSIASEISVSPSTITVPVSFDGTVSESWGNTLNWSGLQIGVTAVELALQINSIGTRPGFLPTYALNALSTVKALRDAVVNGGPTEKDVSGVVVTFSFKSALVNGVDAVSPISANFIVRFSVSVPGGKTVYADQNPIVLEELINSGNVIGGNIDARKFLINSGTMTGVTAFVDQHFSNSGTFSTGLLNVKNFFFNTGTLILYKNGNLNCNMPITK